MRFQGLGNSLLLRRQLFDHTDYVFQIWRRRWRAFDKIVNRAIQNLGELLSPNAHGLRFPVGDSALGAYRIYGRRSTVFSGGACTRQCEISLPKYCGNQEIPSDKILMNAPLTTTSNQTVTARIVSFLIPPLPKPSTPFGLLS